MSRVAGAAVALVALSGCIPKGELAPAPAAAPPVIARPSAVALPPGAPTPTVAPANPVWEARPVTPEARVVADGTIVVQPGDTLLALAATLGTGLGALAQANGLTPPYALTAGRRLIVPGGRYHRVRGGETGIAIARAYRVPWREVVALNGLADPFVLRVGETLRLPGDAQPTPVAAQTEAEPAIADILTGGEPAGPTLAIPARLPRHPARIAAAALRPIAAPSSFSGRFVPPVAGKVVHRFGTMGSGIVNEGVDFGVPVGTAVKAAAEGVVVFADAGAGAYGGLVLIKHGDGYASAYGHLSALAVRRGERVARGQALGESGQSGFADRPLLHFEIRRSARPVDPLPLIGGS